MAKRLRSGYTTGACAAAAAKAAVILAEQEGVLQKVEIPFPDGKRHSFVIAESGRDQDGYCWATIIKDAGDDPDVTNRAEIKATICGDAHGDEPKNCIPLGTITLCGGRGVGRATKPGLAVKVGEPAINPVPRKMIVEAIREVITDDKKVIVVISIRNGEALAKKTLNSRLGIVGGLSVLGTTGIVRPVSADAWTATIKASMAVAREAGLLEIVLSTGRTSERGVQQLLDLPEEAYAMMGDYLEFSLLEAAQQGFRKIHLAGMWAKITKAALRVPQTHVRNGALEMEDAARLMVHCGATGQLLAKIKQANTAREMLEHIQEAGKVEIIKAVCGKAREYCKDVSGCEVEVYLVDSKAEVIG
jgi:cobalt-precorrin-5B (C1)-methyltransferase